MLLLPLRQPKHGRRLSSKQGVKLLCPLSYAERGWMVLVTYTDLFVFCTLIISLINLIVQICQNKKK